MPTQDKSSQNLKLAFAVVLVFGAVARLFDLGGESFWIDEIFSAQIVEGPISEIIQRIPPDKPPLEYFVQALFHRMGSGDPEFWHRLPAALAGIAALPAFFLLGRLWFSRRVGMIAMILAAANPLLVYYSREARPYALFVLLCVWHAVLLSRLWLGEGRPRRLLAGMAALSALIVYTLYSGVPVLAFEFVALAIAAGLRRGEERSRQLKLLAWFGATIGFALVAALPLSMRVKLDKPADFYWSFQLLSWSGASNYLQVIYFPAQIVAMPLPVRIVWTATVPAILALGFAAAWRLHREGALLAASFVLYYLLLPIPYFMLDRVVESRYAITVVVGAILLAAVLLERWSQSTSRSRAMALAFCIFLYSTGTVGIYFAQRPDRPEWREACAEVARLAQPGDAVVTLSARDNPPVEYYLKRAGAEYLPVLSPEKTRDMPLPERVVCVGEIYGADAKTSPFKSVSVRMIVGGAAAASLVPPFREVNGMVELKPARAPEGIVAPGWGPPEFWGETGVRWTNKTRVSLFLPLAQAPDGLRRAVIRFHPFSPEGAPPQTLRLYVNDRALEPLAVKLGEMQELSWGLDAGDLKAGVNTVEIETAWVDTPSKYQKNYADFRILGIAVEALQIIRPEAAPSLP